MNIGASLIAQLVNHLPAMQETRVQLLGWEDTWRRKWQPTAVFLPGESHGQRSLTGYRLQSTGSRELDTTATKPPLVLLGKQRADKLSHRGTQQTSFCTMCASSPLAKETHTRVNRQVDILHLS